MVSNIGAVRLKTKYGRFVLLLVLIAGHSLICGCTYWVKPGASAADAQNALDHCTYEAEKAGASGSGFNVANNRGTVRDMCMKLRGYSKSFSKEQPPVVKDKVPEQIPVVKEQVPLTYTKANYAKLGSPAFLKEYKNKGVSFKIMFIGESRLIDIYRYKGIDTRDRVFINHKDISYRATKSELDLSDAEIPSFALSIDKEKSDIIYESKRGDIFEIKGLAIENSADNGLHILIHEIIKIKQSKSMSKSLPRKKGSQ